MDRPDLAEDSRFASNRKRASNHAALKAELEAALAMGSRDTWLGRLEEAGVPCAPINDVAGVLADPQVLARNMVVTADDPTAGVLKMAGNPIKMSAFADPATRAPAPNLDGDRDEIISELE